MNPDRGHEELKDRMRCLLVAKKDQRRTAPLITHTRHASQMVTVLQEVVKKGMMSRKVLEDAGAVFINHKVIN